MKKIAISLLALAFVSFNAVAQDQKEQAEQQEKKEKAERAEKKETQEIIIRQHGDKDIKLNVEIDGDKVTVNGKPLSEFKDKDVTINKRKMIIRDGDNVMSWNFSNDGDGWQKFGDAFGKNFGESFQKNWEAQGNGKAAFLGVTTEKEGDGAKVVEVVKGSAAEKAGLKKDDIITRIGEEKITSPETLSDVVGFKKPDDEVKITYKRSGKEYTAKATLGKRKQSMNYGFSAPNVRSFTIPRNFQGMPNMEGAESFDIAPYMDFAYSFGRKKIGLKLQDLEEGNGVKVMNVEDSSAAATAGIRKDDIITEIDGKKIDNTDDAREQMAPDEDKRSYKIKVNRAGAEMNFEVKIPRKLKTADL